MKINGYDLKELYTNYVYRIEKNYYEVLNYDGNEEKLKEAVKELNDNTLFNVEWSIYEISEDKAILEEIVDTLD